MNYELSSNTAAIITGASSGIGRATALELAKKGLQLALLARSENDLRAVAEEARAGGASKANYFVCDLRDENSVEEAVSGALGLYGRIDVLINSAGLSLNGEVDGYSLEDWRNVIETNLTGTFLCCRAVAPTMKRQGGGQIINISSGAGRNGIKDMSAYCASKFGVIGFTEAFALEVRNHNIRVSVLLPGSVKTDFSRVANRKQGNRSSEPNGKGYAMTAEEVASVIIAMLEQPAQAWMSEITLRPLNTELKR